MKIENGKWVNDNGDRLTVLETKNIKSLGEKIVSIFGNDITYERIEIVNCLTKKDFKKEILLSKLINNEELLSKLNHL